MTMTSDAKQALKDTVRSLRARLLADLNDATESTWQMGIRAASADLDEATRATRARFEAWTAEQVRTQAPPPAPARAKRTRGRSRATAADAEGSAADAVPTTVAAPVRASRTASETERTADDFRREAEKLAAATLLNRLVMLRLLEAPDPDGMPPMRSPAVVTGGWESRGYKDFRELAPALIRGDATEGFGFLLRLVYADLAMELPGVYGDSGVADLVPIPPATLRHVIEALDDPRLMSCWNDDMTLGWVYQYWNDPEREALDAKINAGGKIEPHEIASKTQLFTERYMVDWLLQNSLGPMWLAICKKHGWTPEVEIDGTLANLESRRVEWRAKRESSEVSLTELMPLHTDAERRWAYYMPQPLSDAAVAKASESVRDLRVIDPAVGSGHFLVVTVDLLWALYREEARHRGLADDPEWSDRAIVERILEYNLHGIDLDPRAVQIAAAALWFAGRQINREARPRRLNLVASNLRLASLPDDDPALVKLRAEVERDIGMPGELVDSVIHALRGADSLGSLLRIDRAVDEAIAGHEKAMADRPVAVQRGLFGDDPKPARQTKIEFDATAARRSLLDRLESFLTRHTGSDDLGLRLAGEQLAAGVRFVRIVREGAYDLVVGNAPYQDTTKIERISYLMDAYPLGKRNLYSAFLVRGLELACVGGFSALLTIRDWMFLDRFKELRKCLLETFALRSLHDMASGAFDEIPTAQVVVTVASAIFQRTPPDGDACALRVFHPRTVTSIGETVRKRAATACHASTYTFQASSLVAVPDWPLVYWWPSSLLSLYQRFPTLGSVSPAIAFQSTGNNERFIRLVHECQHIAALLEKTRLPSVDWAPCINGAEGREWIEPLNSLIAWQHDGLALRVNKQASGQGNGALANESFFFRRGVCFTMIGSRFAARAHRYPSVCGDKGNSLYPADAKSAVCAINSELARGIVQDLNPSVSFQSGDVNRLPSFSPTSSTEIFARIEPAFAVHESHREPSVEYRQPGPSPWRHAQEWAQLAVDRPEGAPLPTYVEEFDPEPATDHLSYALGVALGRFGPHGEGVLDLATADLSHALPGGILFLDRTLDGNGTSDRHDSLFSAACSPLHDAWATCGERIETRRRNIRDWLALDFFADVHKGMYENRPIHWPLSSESRMFVAWVNIHRFNDRTLRLLLADHLVPRLTQIEGELADLRTARDGANGRVARVAEQRLDKLIEARDELAAFITTVEACADKGPPTTDASCPAREQDARYAPHLDDGVMINSAALWPLLEPQWRDPKKWWKELAKAQGRKDYDWSHLAMRYWPTRVDTKSQEDPSLAVAHGCFWRYHPARAWAWELRLQNEIGTDFKITEAPYMPGGRNVGDAGDGPHRDEWLRGHMEEALEQIEKEAERRQGRARRRTTVSEMRILESGLWTEMPAEVWQMEMRLSERQGAEFRLLSPDEPAARAAYTAAHPDLAKDRVSYMAQLKPVAEMFADGDDEDDLSDSDYGADEEPADSDEEEVDVG